jgi:DUF218 domain
MARPALFRRRTVWLPTLPGLALIAVLAAAAGWWAMHHAYDFLAVQAPVRTADGRGARVLVVEGWMNEPDLDQAVAVYRRGHYERVITTGRPIGSWSSFASYADRAADYLRRHGLADATLDAVAAPQSPRDRTYGTAVQVRDWARAQGLRLESVDVFTSDAHARRSRQTYRLALGPGVAVGVLSSAPTEYDPARWWASSLGAKRVIGEVASLAWTSCCFWPDVPPAGP